MPNGTPDTDVPGGASRPLFQEPPDDLGDREWTPGALLVALGSYSGYERIEVARAFRTAAERLLDSAISAREGWEAIYPILFCYRHTTELYLKAILTDAPFRHGLDELASDLQKKVLGKYRQDHVDLLIGRIHEMGPPNDLFANPQTAELKQFLSALH